MFVIQIEELQEKWKENVKESNWNNVENMEPQWIGFANGRWNKSFTRDVERNIHKIEYKLNECGNLFTAKKIAVNIKNLSEWRWNGTIG